MPRPPMPPRCPPPLQLAAASPVATSVGTGRRAAGPPALGPRPGWHGTPLLAVRDLCGDQGRARQGRFSSSLVPGGQRHRVAFPLAAAALTAESEGSGLRGGGPPKRPRSERAPGLPPTRPPHPSSAPRYWMNGPQTASKTLQAASPPQARLPQRPDAAGTTDAAAAGGGGAGGAQCGSRPGCRVRQEFRGARRGQQAGLAAGKQLRGRHAFIAVQRHARGGPRGGGGGARGGATAAGQLRGQRHASHLRLLGRGPCGPQWHYMPHRQGAVGPRVEHQAEQRGLHGQRGRRVQQQEGRLHGQAHQAGACRAGRGKEGGGGEGGRKATHGQASQDAVEVGSRQPADPGAERASGAAGRVAAGAGLGDLQRAPAPVSSRNVSEAAPQAPGRGWAVRTNAAPTLVWR